MHIIAIGGSDAGISAALRARELEPGTEVTVVVADAYPNFSICGIPYYVSGEVTNWANLAHRTIADLEATGMGLRLDTVAQRIDVEGRQLLVTGPNGDAELLPYDELIVGTGAVPVRPPISGLSGQDALGSDDGVHLLHSMGDTFAVMRTLEERNPASALIVGAGYIGLEMAEALVARGLVVAQMEQLPEVLPTVDPALGALVHAQLTDHGVEVLTGTTVRSITRARGGDAGRLLVQATTTDGEELARSVDMVLVVVGVRPDTELAASAGASLADAAPSLWTATCVPTFPTFSLPVTAWLLTTACSGRPTFPWAPRPTNRAGWRARTPWAVTGSSPAAWAPRWSRFSTTPSPAPG